METFSYDYVEDHLCELAEFLLKYRVSDAINMELRVNVSKLPENFNVSYHQVMNEFDNVINKMLDLAFELRKF